MSTDPLDLDKALQEIRGYLFQSELPDRPFAAVNAILNEILDLRTKLAATPAPESPAPARTDLDWDLINRVSKAHAQSFMAPEVGTGSETSPDAGAPKREATPNVPLAKKPMRYDESWRLIELMVQYLETDRIMGVRVPETSLDWVRAAKAYLAAHPVAEAEQSPLPAALDALRKLERACQDLGSTALPVWDYNPPDYLKKEWEVLADMLVEVAPALAQAPTRKRLIVESPDAERPRREAQP